jgi:hypothetical protein
MSRENPTKNEINFPKKKEENAAAKPDMKKKMAGPQLRYIMKTLEILRGAEDENGEKTHWSKLYKQVKPFNSAVELTDNIREVVRAQIDRKIPALKEMIPSIKDLDDHLLAEALANNYFEYIGEEVEDTRKEVLLAVAAHLAKRMETVIYLNILKNASQEDLNKIGFDEDYRDLLIGALDASTAADPLFIRFLAFTQLTKNPPENATAVALHNPEDNKLHTIADLFPHESWALSRKFAEISRDNEKWISKPGGKEFLVYLEKLSLFFCELDVSKAEKLKEELVDLYKNVLAENFPVIITPPIEGYYKPPYMDPEIRISIMTADSRKQEESFQNIQKTMADSLGELGLEKFKQPLNDKMVRSVVALGSYGVNLTFSSVAQEDPAILMYLNEQIRGYDKLALSYSQIIENYAVEFGNLPDKEKITMIEEMSRTNTIMHEFSHAPFPDKSPEAEHLGETPVSSIDEIKAETLYRALIPSIIEKGGLKGTKEQWAIGTLISSLQLLRGNPESDEYYLSASYAINKLFKAGAIEVNQGKVVIKDYDAYYAVNKDCSQEIIALYQNDKIKDRQAKKWLKDNAAPNEQTKALEEMLKANKNLK